MAEEPGLLSGALFFEYGEGLQLIAWESFCFGSQKSPIYQALRLYEYCLKPLIRSNNSA